MSWTKLSAVERPHTGCLNCGPKPVTLPKPFAGLDLHPGFGVLALIRDGEHVWSSYRPEDSRTVLGFERQATKDPDHDWRIEINGPLSSAVYQRHGKGEWVMVDSGMGFA